MPGDQASEEAKLAVSTSHLLHRVQQLASDRFAALVGEDGVTLRQFVVMAAIADAPGVSQIDLVRTTGVDRSTLADIVTRLARNGLVDRAASEADARANAISLSEKGAATLAAVRQHARAADAAILDALPRLKRKAFVALLVRLSAHADEIEKKAERDAKRKAKREAKRKAQKRKTKKRESASETRKPKRRDSGR
ncbi:MAG: MarR family winged helix-turn-helix transcriptional regulator [Hyphomonadaceae bacterium]